MKEKEELKKKCTCEKPPFVHKDFDVKILGVDNGYGEFEIQKCKTCGQNWLRYFVDYNHPLIKTGRWFRGEIYRGELNRITISNAKEYLEGLDWYFYGGTYFGTEGKKGGGKINLEI